MSSHNKRPSATLQRLPLRTKWECGGGGGGGDGAGGGGQESKEGRRGEEVDVLHCFTFMYSSCAGELRQGPGAAALLCVARQNILGHTGPQICFFHLEESIKVNPAVSVCRI